MSSNRISYIETAKGKHFSGTVTIEAQARSTHSSLLQLACYLTPINLAKARLSSIKQLDPMVSNVL